MSGRDVELTTARYIADPELPSNERPAVSGKKEAFNAANTA